MGKTSICISLAVLSQYELLAFGAFVKYAVHIN